MKKKEERNGERIDSNYNTPIEWNKSNGTKYTNNKTGKLHDIYQQWGNKEIGKNKKENNVVNQKWTNQKVKAKQVIFV